MKELFNKSSKHEIIKNSIVDFYPHLLFNILNLKFQEVLKWIIKRL